MSIRKTQRINAVQGSIRRSVWVENVLSLPWIETRFHGRWVCTLVVVTVTYLCSWGTAVVTSRRSNRYSFRNVVCMMLPLPPETNFRALRAGFTLRRGIEGGVCVCVCVCFRRCSGLGAVFALPTGWCEMTGLLKAPRMCGMKNFKQWFIQTASVNGCFGGIFFYILFKWKFE